MRSFRRWFRRATADAPVVIGHSHVRLAAIDSALFMTRSDDPTIEAFVYFRSPYPEIGRIRVKYRGPEAEKIRALLRGLPRH
jgi:hypothetical protein